MNTRPAGMWIQEDGCRAMLAHVSACLPEEGCGLLGGRFDERGIACVEVVVPVENELHSPVRFRMAPLEQLRVFQEIERLGLDLVGIFHSHPTGPDHPSATDLADFFYPGVPVVIISPGAAGGWQVKGFLIEDSHVMALDRLPCYESSEQPGPE
jgi:proteasome lid subunit RPN8/RPN11